MIALLLALCLPAFLPFAAVLARASTRSLKDLDGPIVPLAPAKLPVKGAWQLWYFDFVSASDDTSLQVAFYSGFPFGPLLGKDVPYYVQVSGTFSNGTPWDFYAPTTGLGQVSHSKSGPSYGTQGAWPGVGGWSASGNDDSPSWLVTFDTGPGGVAGNLTLNQVAPPHYPCDSKATPNFSSELELANLLGPNFGWSNAVPGATGSVSFTLNGQSFVASGSAYHDSNFAEIAPIQEHTGAWIFARGLVGEYTFVLYAYVPAGDAKLAHEPPQEWYTSGYVAKGGPAATPLVSFCSSGQTDKQHAEQYFTLVTVGSLWSGGSGTAGSATEAQMDGLQAVFHNGVDSWAFNITSRAVVIAGAPSLPYSRFTTSITGGQVTPSGTFSTGEGTMDYIQFYNRS